jgi:SAM-dependent methyltransferase
MAFTENEINAFWESHPCGDQLLGGLDDKFRGDFASFFDAYDEARYRVESHIPGCLDALNVRGQRVLEIGLGQGTESEGLIRRGARWTGLDLTTESVRRVSTRLHLRELSYDAIWQGSVTSIPARDATFDIVFSHGVLHHVPDIATAQSEIHRVLKPRGRLVAMLYARRSLNYAISISIVRRAAVLAAWPFRDTISAGNLSAHLGNAEREGLWEYLRLGRFTHASTDGPANPFSRVYDLATVCRDFPSFRLIRAHKEFMHAPPLPVHGLPGARLMGWHLWVDLEAR